MISALLIAALVVMKTRVGAWAQSWMTWDVFDHVREIAAALSLVNWLVEKQLSARVSIFIDKLPLDPFLSQDQHNHRYEERVGGLFGELRLRYGVGTE